MPSVPAPSQDWLPCALLAARHVPARITQTRFAVGAMGLTVLFMCFMGYTMHAALREMRGKGGAADRSSDEERPLNEEAFGEHCV